MKNVMLHSIGTPVGRYTISPETLAWLLENKHRSCRFMFDDAYAAVSEFLAQRTCPNLGSVAVFPVVGRVGKTNDWDVSVELAGRRLMGWDEILALSGRGVIFGSHTMSHRNLNELTEDELQRELRESKAILEEKLNKPIEGLAYPFGRYSQRVVAAVTKAGYKWAVTTCPSPWVGAGNPFRTRRTEIKGYESPLKMWYKLSEVADIVSVVEIPLLICEKLLLRFTRPRPRL